MSTPKRGAPDRQMMRHRQLSEDWQEVARSPAGRRIIADLMGWGWVFQPIEENEPLAMARMNGERNFALRVARLLTLEPEHFPNAMRENNEATKEWMGTEPFNDIMASYFASGAKFNS